MKHHKLVIITKADTVGWTHELLLQNCIRADMIVPAKTTTGSSLKAAIERCENIFAPKNESVRVILNGGLASRLEPISQGNKGGVPLADGTPMLLRAIHQAIREPVIVLPQTNVYCINAVDILHDGQRLPPSRLIARWLNRWGCLMATVPFRPWQDYDKVKGFALTRRGRVCALEDSLRVILTRRSQSENIVREYALTSWFTGKWFRETALPNEAALNGDFFGATMPTLVRQNTFIRELYLGKRAWVYDVGSLAPYIAYMQVANPTWRPNAPMPTTEDLHYWLTYLEGLRRS